MKGKGTKEGGAARTAKKDEMENILEEERGPVRESERDGDLWELLRRRRREDISTISGSLKCLQKRKSQFEEGKRKRETTLDFKEERL